METTTYAEQKIPKFRMRTGRKAQTTRHVRDAAIERIDYLFANFDQISVSFSGGKDSTACLNLALAAARRRNRLPVRAIFFDEEVIGPPTVEYVERVRNWPGVELEWYCLPIRHRNACSNTSPWWLCWDPAIPERWVRELPACAITSHPKFKPGMTLPEFGSTMLGRNECCIQGVRTQESMRRFRMIAAKVNDHFIARKGGHAFAYPIYDWSSTDVWRLVREEKLDYNRTYDLYNRTQLYNELLAQRVCAPFGEEPLRGLWKYAECWPDMWHKMLNRVPGVATAWRYANTELYGTSVKPEWMSWRDYAELQLSNYSEPEIQAEVRARVAGAITEHRKKTDDPIPEDEPHLLTGISWKFLAKIAVKGDFKGRTGQMLANVAIIARNKKGVSLETAIANHANEKFKAHHAAAR